jgi:hypothetical protein
MARIHVFTRSPPEGWIYWLQLSTELTTSLAVNLLRLLLASQCKSTDVSRNELEDAEKTGGRRSPCIYRINKYQTAVHKLHKTFVIIHIFVSH